MENVAGRYGRGLRACVCGALAVGLVALAAAAEPKVVVIAPDDLVEMWTSEYAERVPEITGGTYEVVATGDIYRAYPYAADHADGRPRNPAESIHAYVAAHAAETAAFILGGPWVDVNDLATNRVMKLATGETLTLANTVPGVKVCPDSRYCSPTDLYYACPDAANLYAWDANGDGVYLDPGSFADSDLTAAVAVTRLPLVTWSEWKHADGSTYTQRDLLAAYVAKLRRGLASDFDGRSRYGIYGYLINEPGVQRLGGENEAWVERQETAFYDGGYNMFDPARGSDDFWLVEGVSRRHVRDQIARARPVDDVNGFLEATFSRRHADWNAARSAWTNENYALRYYYAHGTRGGGHGFGMNDYTREGCGLTLFDDCAGPCSTGKIEFDADGVYQMNYAIACVMSPFGGSLATVNNSDFGIADLHNYWKTFAPNDSWRHANNYLVGFALSNLTVGAAWRFNVTDFVTNYQFNKSGVDTWMLAEEMLLGDPLVKLPSVESGLPYAEGIAYAGFPGKTDTVVSLAVGPDANAIVAPETPLKVLNGLTVDGTALTLCTGEGGVGGPGIVFAGTKGSLTLAGDAPFYVAGVRNVASLKIQGSHLTVDFDGVELDGSSMGQLTIAAAEDVTFRSATEGAFAKIRNNLSVPRGGSVRLATWNAFGSGAAGEIYLGKDSELVIDANPWYHDGRDRGESLNAKVNVLNASNCPRIRVARGGYFTPVAPLATAGGVSYEIDARDGLGGEVTVPAKARLTLKELPLSKIATLTVESGATLVIPEGTTLDDLLSSGTATLAAGTQVTCGETTVTLDAARTVDGSAYVTKTYYTETATDWSASTKVSLTPDGPADQPVDARTRVRFAKDFGPVYIQRGVVCSAVDVVDGAHLQIGYWDNTWTVPAGWTVNVEAGARLTVARWSNATRGAVSIGDGVTLDGAGKVDFAATVTSVTCGSLSGTATLDVSVPLETTGTVANVLTGAGSVTTSDPATVFRVDAGWTGTFAVRSAGQAYEAVYGEPADGIRTVTFAPAQTVDPTAFGRTWTWFYTGADGTFENAANWSAVSEGRLVPAAKVPLLTGSNVWDPALFNGALMDVPVSAEGYREIVATGKVEGWELRLGLTNGVSLTVNELEKLQIGAAQYVCVDATSRLRIRKINLSKALTVPFEIAAPEGVVFENVGAVSGYTFVYSLAGDGSIRFTESCGLARHRIAAAEISLGEGEARTVRSKRVIALDPAKGNAPDVAFAAEARVRTDDPAVTATLKAGPLTAEDAVGSCALRIASDGVYLDFVGRSAPADWPETIPPDATAASLGVTDAAWRDEPPENVRLLAVWAKAQGVSLAAVNAGALAFDADGNPSNRLTEAFLLNCAEREVDARKAAFRFATIVPGEEPAIDASGFNGTVDVLGAPALEGPWQRASSAARFFKAVLVKRLRAGAR